MTTEILIFYHSMLQDQDHTDNVCVHFNVTGERIPLYSSSCCLSYNILRVNKLTEGILVDLANRPRDTVMYINFINYT